MAYKVIILYRLYMPSYFLGTFTEYPILRTGITFCKIRYFLSAQCNKLTLHKAPVLSDILLPDDKYLPDGLPAESTDEECAHYDHSEPQQ